MQNTTTNASGTPQPLFTTKAWYFPEGVKNGLKMRKGSLRLFQGYFTVTDSKTGQEVRRVTLVPGTTAKSWFGHMWLTPVDGQKIGLFSRGHGYAFLSFKVIIALLFLLFVVQFFPRGTAIRVILSLIFLAFGPWIVVSAIVKARRFAKAIQQQLTQGQ